MKKFLLLATLLIGSLAYGNDGDFKGKDNQEINKVKEVHHTNGAPAKENMTKEELEKEIRFEKTVDMQDKGHDRD